MQLWLINLLLPQKMNKSGLSQKPYWDSQNSRRDPSDPIIDPESMMHWLPISTS